MEDERADHHATKQSLLQMWGRVERADAYADRLNRKRREMQRQLEIAVGKVEDLRRRWENDRCRCRDPGSVANPLVVIEEEGEDEESSEGPPTVCLLLPIILIDS